VDAQCRTHSDRRIRNYVHWLGTTSIQKTSTDWIKLIRWGRHGTLLIRSKKIGADHYSYQIMSVLGTFILGMILYPDVQRRAQASIDAVVGNSRLPCFSDKDAIPYVDALVYETLRWNPVAPLGTAINLIDYG
jgi:hypothetical protein